MAMELDAGMETLAVHMVSSIVETCTKAGLNARETLAGVRQFYLERQRPTESLFREMGQDPEPFAQKLTETIIAAIDRQLIEMKNGVGLA